jgi:hypothetical protein
VNMLVLLSIFWTLNSPRESNILIRRQYEVHIEGIFRRLLPVMAKTSECVKKLKGGYFADKVKLAM